ncbi:hypothetical protein PENVUL_c024G05521 [Penicillium vulpinum]|uniref:Uncharacterized protein n=1 Tax=Penicillium vulpinum TaxID=29845 RepID=A0A1V6RVE1_9EURO|nr:hypothetical protein PENVUL_c024G05521 [Penicillium vulpinum]
MSGAFTKKSTASDILTQYDGDDDSDIQTVILCDNPSGNDPDTLHTSSSSQEHPSAISDKFLDDSSDGSSSGSNSPSGAKSEASSIDSFDMRPETPLIASFKPSAQENSELKTSTAFKTSTQYDRDNDSDVQTVIFCGNTSENDSNTLHAPSSSQKDPSSISSTLSDDFSDNISDDSSVGSASADSDSCFSAKSESSSIDSFDTPSQHDSESEDDEAPRGSQSGAAYASPLQDGRRIQTSCDSIHDMGRWHVDPDGFINEKYRAGGPYLCALPVTILNLKGSSPLWTVLETTSIYKMILSVLEQHKISASSTKIKKCENKHEPEAQPMATLIITATRDAFSDAWVQACREIWQNLFDNQLGHVNVEISNPIIHEPFRVLPMGPRDRIHSVQSAVIQRIEHEVDLTDCLHYGTMRIGTTQDTKNSEVVMFLKVDFKSKRDWRGPRDQILSILEEFKLPMVGVMIMKGRMWGGSFGLPERRRKPENSELVAQIAL